MQQLIQQPPHWRLEQKILHCEFAPFLSQHAFGQWAQRLSAQQNWHIVSLEQGADRAQMHFSTNGNDMLLCFEATCQAIWIESIQELELAAYTTLYSSLQTIERVSD